MLIPGFPSPPTFSPVREAFHWFYGKVYWRHYSRVRGMHDGAIFLFFAEVFH